MVPSHPVDATNTPPSPSLAYFDHVLAAHDAAVQSAQTFSSTYRIGSDLAFEVRFAAPALQAQFGPALAPRAVGGGEGADLTVLVWDSATSGGEIPRPPPALGERLDGRGEIRGFSDGRISGAYQAWGALSLYDAERNLGIYWMQDAGSLPWFETSHPLALILQWWLVQRQSTLVHAAGIGADHRGALLAGESGSGKSTTALLCLADGLDWLGDDYVIVSNRPEPVIRNVYGSAKLEGSSTARPPQLETLAADNPDHKSIFSVHEVLPDRLCAEAPLTALLFPRVTPQRSTSSRSISPAQALLAMGPNTIAQLPSARPETFAALSALVQRVPAYQVDLGTDFGQIAPHIRAILTSARR